MELASPAISSGLKTPRSKYDCSRKACIVGCRKALLVVKPLEAFLIDRFMPLPGPSRGPFVVGGGIGSDPAIVHP
jgi:hypothetical protein